MANHVPLRIAFLTSLTAGLLLVNASSITAIEPEIHADGTVSFRINAPDARQVQIDVKGRTSNANDDKPFDMKDAGEVRIRP